MSPGAVTSLADAEVAVVIVNYRTPQLTMRCVDSLRGEKELLPKLSVVVVDGGSGDESAAQLEAFVDQPELRSWVSLLSLSTNGGFGWANNQAILTLARQLQPPEFIYLLNPDAEVTGGAVVKLVEEMEAHPGCGAAGSQLLTPDGKPAASAFRFPSLAREFIAGAQSAKLGRLLGIAPIATSADESVEVDWVTGASVLLRAEALRETGLFDDGFFLYFDEVELMHRFRSRGWTVRYLPSSRVKHVEGASTGLGAAAEARPFPSYWYQSRRRFFGLTGGRGGVVAANLSLLSGKAVATLKRALGRPAANEACRARDLLHVGFWPAAQDFSPSVPSWGDTPGRPPAWMIRQ